VPRTSLPQSATLEEHRALLNDLHHEISNQGGRDGELYERAFVALLSLTIAYFTPDFYPGVTIKVQGRP
jgi:hypothetical protein